MSSNSAAPRTAPAATTEPFFELDQAILADRRVYFEHVLKVRSGPGTLEPLILNRAQAYADSAYDRQLEEKGKVRALVLKARKVGISTGVAGRFYKRTATQRYIRTAIIGHKEDSTAVLHEMARTFWRESPAEYRPVARSRQDGLVFPLLSSSYALLTAGSKESGRSDTFQQFHGSEVGFWPKPEETAAGAMGAVPNSPGSEIILESTANGLGGWWYDQWQLAEKGESDYIAVFIPWFWHPEYMAPAPLEMRLEPDEIRLRNLYSLSREQLQWRRLEVKRLRSVWRFRQEYPCDPVEAFQAQGQEGLIPGDAVLEARKRKIDPDPDAALVLGVDCARSLEGDHRDATRLISRQGRVAGHLCNKILYTRDTMQIVAAVASFIKLERPQAVFVDVGGIGAGVYDRLVELGFTEIVRAVNFGSKPINENRYSNKRCEIWDGMREWIEDPVPCSIPDDDVLHRHLVAPTFGHDSSERLVLEKKRDIKKRLKFSPDGGDALATTFAEPVVKPAEVRSLPRSTLRHRLMRGSGMAR